MWDEEIYIYDTKKLFNLIQTYVCIDWYNKNSIHFTKKKSIQF